MPSPGLSGARPRPRKPLRSPRPSPQRTRGADEDSFLSISPIDGSADCVFVCSPYPHIQTVRDVIVPLAFAAGFAVVDDQDGMVLDPRTAREGTFTASGQGVIPTITPTLVDRADSTGRRNTLTVEVVDGGDEGLVGEDTRRS